MPIRFNDRTVAGVALAERLVTLRGQREGIILGIAPGGIVVAAEVARALQLPLEPFVLVPVAQEGRPGRQVGVIATGGVRVIDQAVVTALQLPRRLVDEESEIAERELARQERLLRRGMPPIDVRGKLVIVIDEIAISGHTLAMAVRALRLLGADTIIAAAPVIASDAATHIAAVADRCVALVIAPAAGPPPTRYEDLAPVTPDQARAVLDRHWREASVQPEDKRVVLT